MAGNELLTKLWKVYGGKKPELDVQGRQVLTPNQILDGIKRARVKGMDGVDLEIFDQVTEPKDGD